MIYSILLQWHGYLQWAILIYLPFATIYSFRHWRLNKIYTKRNEIMARLSIALVHSQMLLGILLMTHSPKVNFQQLDEHQHFLYSILHPALMMLAIIAITLALMIVRNLKTNSLKNKWTLIFNSLGYAIIVITLFIH
jgi:hypothetical protein